MTRTETSLRLRWIQPAQHEECIFAYRICYEIETSGLPTTCIDTAPVVDFNANPYEHLLSGLEPCALYYITVRPVTPNGLLGPVTPVEESTLGDGQRHTRSFRSLLN